MVDSNRIIKGTVLTLITTVVIEIKAINSFNNGA